MSMVCKQCSESFPKNQPYDVFELRSHQYLPADPDGATHNDMIVDGGAFCSRKCLADYVKANDKPGLELGSQRGRL